MYISYVFGWLWQVMQIKLPIVFSDKLVFNISIANLFWGSCYLFITYLVLRFFLTGVISYEKSSIKTKFVHKYQEAKNNVFSGKNNDKESGS